MQSMEDFGMNEDGEFDADVVETGNSKPQRDRIKTVELFIQEQCEQSADNETTAENVIQGAVDDGIERDKAEDTLESILTEIGSAYTTGANSDGEKVLKWIGRAN
jgi:replicative DNA helicase Mcm